ncbi:MAG: hypothetical protein KatS3mg068_1529 [Candidatus Sericytochromatia bacterium]|nr:MAG: hypothetical protein KatS3mg068_1529 [Candidatus Sericytochromatia bacterium]
MAKKKSDGSWIQKAIKKEGSFRDYCGGKVTKACIEKGKKSKDPKTRRRAVLAETLLKLNRKRKK